MFFTTHDPTTPNRQGNDVGPQYRSVIFYHDAEQERIAREVIKSVNDRRIWNRAIVTEVSPLPTFYPAEAYHDDYFARNPGQPLLSGDHRAEGGEAAEAAYGQAESVSTGLPGAEVRFTARQTVGGQRLQPGLHWTAMLRSSGRG